MEFTSLDGCWSEDRLDGLNHCNFKVYHDGGSFSGQFCFKVYPVITAQWNDVAKCCFVGLLFFILQQDMEHRDVKAIFVHEKEYICLKCLGENLKVPSANSWRPSWSSSLRSSTRQTMATSLSTDLTNLSSAFINYCRSSIDSVLDFGIYLRTFFLR